MKRVICIILSIILLTSLSAISVFTSFAAPTSGECGDNVSWRYDSKTKTLTISGTGAMNDYNNVSVPWASYQSEIKAGIVEEGVTSLGTCAFCYCTVMTSVTLPDSLTAVGNYGFYNSSKLSSVFFSGSRTDLSGISISKNNNPLTRAKTYSLKGKCGNRLIYEYSPATHVLTIDGNGFMYDFDAGKAPWYPYRSEINSVVLEGSVSNIGAYAFYDCFSMGSVSIPDNISEIENNAFNGCTALWEIRIPDSITEISPYTFYNCMGLTHVYLPDTLTSIGDYAFWKATFTTIDIPDSVKTIGKGAFGECWSLTECIIPDGVEEISDYLFYCCGALKRVVIPGSVKTIGEYAFTVCSKLGDIYYIGTDEEWGVVEITSRGNNVLKTVSVKYFTRCRAYGHDYVDGMCTVCGSTDPHYVPPYTPGALKGDVNGDGEVTVGDILFVRNYVTGAASFNSVQLKAADVNGDGDVTIKDVLLIRQYVSGAVEL